MKTREEGARGEEGGSRLLECMESPDSIESPGFDFPSHSRPPAVPFWMMRAWIRFSRVCWEYTYTWHILSGRPWGGPRESITQSLMRTHVGCYCCCRCSMTRDTSVPTGFSVSLFLSCSLAVLTTVVYPIFSVLSFSVVVFIVRCSFFLFFFCSYHSLFPFFRLL